MTWSRAAAEQSAVEDILQGFWVAAKWAVALFALVLALRAGDSLDALEGRMAALEAKAQ